VVDTGRGFDPARLPSGIRRPVVRQHVRRVAALRRHRAAGGPAVPGPVTMRRSLGRGRRPATRDAIAQLPESGRGLAIMRACVDDVTLRSGPGQGTVVSLEKRIGRRATGPLATVPRPRLRDAS
jgi:anti-sigma regulatory factor (Ser/Thr protein kinase)